MHDYHKYLEQILILLFVSIINVVLSRRLKLSPVLGYLVLGAFIGDYGFRYISNDSFFSSLSEFGVVFLLFAIGLELTFERLIQMRLHVFGFGGLQIVVTTILISLCLHEFFSMPTSVSIVIGCALSLSSTAVVMQVLTESKRQSTKVGRLSLSVLLMQDFAVVPLLAILPLLQTGEERLLTEIGWAGFSSLLAIIIITIFGRIFLRPFFKIIGSAKSEEIYVATTLLIVLGASYLSNLIAGSTAMGAFIAGILIAETEYHNRVEASIIPFKGLLLGLFFLTVGMSINFDFIISEWAHVALLSLTLIIIKVVGIALVSFIFRMRIGVTLHTSILLAQGSEFAFILFNLAAREDILDQNLAQLLLVVVAITMAVSPLLSMLGRFIEDSLDSKQELDKSQEFVGVSDLSDHVIVAGFGRVGRVIARMLEENKFNYIAVDNNLQLVKKAREQGFPVYHGDLSNPDVLRAVGAKRASAAILTMSDKLSLRKAVKSIYIHYPNLESISRAEDFKHGQGLKKLGASLTVPATIETGLQLGGALLKNLGVAEHDILALKDLFRQNNYSFTEEIELFRGVAPNKQTLDD